jgi:serine/threonine protein kinase
MSDLLYIICHAWLQVAVGLQYLHSRKPHPIIHGDLKTTNILLENDGEHAVIADYGLADWLGYQSSAMPPGVQTTSSKPPELLQNPDAPSTPPSDSYAFGVVLLEFMTGKPAFRGMPNQDIKSMVCSGKRPPIPEFVPQIVSDIITDCWAQDPLQRPPFSDIAAGMQVAIQEALGGQFAETTTTMAWN